MTPAELRRAAEWLECGHWIDPHTAASPWRDDEIPELARKLRAEAEAAEPTRPRLPVETCPACGGTGWQD